MNNKVVYRHIRLDTNLVFYIGYGNLDRPYSKKNRNKHWLNITNKTEYEVQILKSNLSIQDAKELEIILVDYYGRQNLGTGILVNLTDGGDGCDGLKHSDETKKKISEKLTGITISDDRKRQISKRLKGNTYTLGKILSREHIIKSIIGHLESGKTKGTSKQRGVSFDNRNNKWSAYIKIDYKKKFLGYYSNEEDAIKVAVNAINDRIKELYIELNNITNDNN